MASAAVDSPVVNVGLQDEKVEVVAAVDIPVTVLDAPPDALSRVPDAGPDAPPQEPSHKSDALPQESDTALDTASSPQPDAIDYPAWDAAIVAAIAALPSAERKTRSQQFVGTHPTALHEFRTLLSETTLPLPLHPFQLHPTYLLRFLLAEWRDEETKEFRTSLPLILSESLTRILATQNWRAGTDECWARFGFPNMDDMYASYRQPANAPDAALAKWFFQGFYGVDKSGYPVHYELLPDTYREEHMTTVIMRRILNNEKTLRERIPRLNPAPEAGATPAQLADPKIGVTWVLDARKIGLFVVPAVYKTMSGMISYSNRYASAHYPEQGYRAFVVNLGNVLVSLYHVAIKLMPAQTQRTTNCYGGREVLDEVVGEEAVPVMFRKGGAKNGETLTEEEARRQVETGDAGPWVQVEA